MGRKDEERASPKARGDSLDALRRPLGCLTINQSTLVRIRLRSTSVLFYVPWPMPQLLVGARPSSV
jgi:hypothetical protein